MEERYDPQKVELKWQRYWAKKDLYRTEFDPSRKKFYCLEMFPYPSGEIHMGHARNYAIGAVVARYKRMRGYNVLHPMGWDAFGLPVENAAIKHSVHPSTWYIQKHRLYEKPAQSNGRFKFRVFYKWCSFDTFPNNVT